MTSKFENIDVTKAKIEWEKPLYSTKFIALKSTKEQTNPKSIPKELGINKTALTPTACYSSMLRHTLFNNKEQNLDRVFTMFAVHKPNYPLSYKEQGAWIRLAKKFKLLPQYVNPKESLIKSTFEEKFADVIEMLLNIAKLNITQLYTYLVTFRNLRDEPNFVKALLYLYSKVGMNFFAAYVLALHFNNSNTGHSLVPACTGPYCKSKPSPSELKDNINIKYMVNFQRLVNNPHKYDDRLLMKLDGYKNWNFEQILEGVSTKTDLIIPIKDLFNKYIIRAIMSNDDLSFKEAIKQYKEEK